MLESSLQFSLIYSCKSVKEALLPFILPVPLIPVPRSSALLSFSALLKSNTWKKQAAKPSARLRRCALDASLEGLPFQRDFTG